MTKIYVVGDSTVAEFHDPYLYPRYGYGTMLKDYFKDVEIINLALSGRSSKSFINEKNYQRLFEELSKDDFLLIGFGHNDEKSDDRLRFTDARLPKSEPSSFAHYLEEYYIKPAKRVGAIPVLCTPICRLSATNDYTTDCAHITSHGNYKDVILRLGEETGTLAINLTDSTKMKYEALGYEKALNYYAIIAGKLNEEGKVVPNLSTVDCAHLNIFGAKYVAFLVASIIQKTNHPLKKYLKKDINEPTIDFLKSNPEYEVKSYNPPELSNYQPIDAFKTFSEGWYGTAFGAAIGDATSNGFIAKENELQHFIVGQSALQLHGQLSLSSDGFAFCFRQIPVKKNFKLSAKATILKATPTKQAGFGIMLRDDCYIEQKTTSEMVTSNYIASGLITTDTSLNPIFYKENVSLHKEEPVLEFLYKEAEEAFVQITRIGQSIECILKYKDKLYTKVYVDFDLLQLDQKYMYVGFFATKGTLVEFSDVDFKILGETKGA